MISKQLPMFIIMYSRYDNEGLTMSKVRISLLYKHIGCIYFANKFIFCGQMQICGTHWKRHIPMSLLSKSRENFSCFVVVSVFSQSTGFKLFFNLFYMVLRFIALLWRIPLHRLPPVIISHCHLAMSVTAAQCLFLAYYYGPLPHL